MNDQCCRLSADLKNENKAQVNHLRRILTLLLIEEFHRHGNAFQCDLGNVKCELSPEALVDIALEIAWEELMTERSIEVFW